MPIILTVSAKQVVKLLVCIVLCLLFADVVTQYSRFYLPSTIIAKLAPLFDLNAEATIPAWYQSATLLLCALVLTLISWIKQKARARYRVHWWMLAFIFFYLSMDESAGLHERMTGPIRALLGVSGIFYYAWVIPAMLLVCGFAVVYLPFFLHLPARIRWLLLLATTYYIGGAVGMEMLNGYYAATAGTENFTYELMTTVEESGEMAGVIVLMYALLTYLHEDAQEIQIAFNDHILLTRSGAEEWKRGVPLQ